MNSECKSYVKSLVKAGNAGRTRAKKLSGYNIFCMEHRVCMDGTPKEIMTKLGGLWKTADKEAYNAKSVEFNRVSVSEFTEVPEDSQVAALKEIVAEAIKQFKKTLKKTKAVVPEAVVPEAVVPEVAVPVEEVVEEAVSVKQKRAKKERAVV
jgi:hypothetical protein